MSGPKIDPKLPLGAEPRVQLLPQSVRDRVKAAAIRRRLGMLVALAIVVVGGGYALAFLQNLTAQQELETARNQTQAVLAQQAQYADGSRAAALVAGIRAAQSELTAHEIDWDAVLDAVRALAPEGTTLDEVAAVAQATWEPELSVEGPLRAPRIALLTLTFVGPQIVDAATASTRLSTIPGYIDARFDSSVDVAGAYRTVVRLMLDEQAATQRFPAAGAEGSGDSTTPGDESSDGSNG